MLTSSLCRYPPPKKKAYKNMAGTKTLVTKLQRKSVELAKPAGGVRAIYRVRCSSGPYSIVSNLRALRDCS